MPAFEVKPEGGVEGVTGFVTQNPHALGVSTAFDFQHLLPFELYQSGVRKVKRNGNPGDAIGRKPLFRQPNMGFKANSAYVEFVVEALYVGLQKRPLDFDVEVSDAQVEQLFVAETMPGESVAHGEQILANHPQITQIANFLRNLWMDLPFGPFRLALSRSIMSTQIWQRLPSHTQPHSRRRTQGLCLTT